MFINLLAEAATTEKVVTIISSIAVAGLFIAAVILSATQKKLGNKNAKAVVFGALAVAMSFVLSYVTVYKMPFGGSITLASLVPLVIYAYCFGVSRGIIVGLVYGLLQFIQAPYFLNFAQFILDYLLAFSSIAVAGLFKPIKSLKISLPLATAAACLVRLCFHILAGMLFYSEVGSRAEIFPTLIANVDALPAFVYALLYNSIFLIPDMLICVVVIVLLTQNKVFVSKIKEMAKIGSAFSFFSKKKTVTADGDIDATNTIDSENGETLSSKIEDSNQTVGDDKSNKTNDDEENKQ